MSPPFTPRTESADEQVDVRTLEGRAFRLGRFPWLTAAAIFLNVAVYTFTAHRGPLDIDAMVRFGGKVAPLIIDLGQFWRLLTANFLHRDALHLALNMFVLFGVGGALENLYRPLDFLALLLFCGMATMSVSLVLSDAISVGASGMVYGCLGGLVMFGLKHRALLPTRYRRILAEGAIPTVLIFLWIGWTSSGVDNSAHLGGLLAGIALGAFLRPMMLLGPPRSRWRIVLRALAVAGLVAAPIAAGPLFPRMPPLRTELDDAFGISIQLPREWRRSADRLGQLAYYNGLPGLGRATFAAEATVLDESFEMAEQAQAFIRESLQPQSLGREVARVTASAPVPTRIADREAIRIEASYEEASGVMRSVAYFIRRGELVYQLVFTHPAAFPRYGAVMQGIAQTLKFREPRELREARARALLFPGAPWALATLGTALRQLGDSAAAVEALKSAVREQPTSSLFRAQLAMALLQNGQLEEACQASAEAVQRQPEDPKALEADARCELARGHSDKALERLHSATTLAPADDRLRRAEEALRAALATPPR